MRRKRQPDFKLTPAALLQLRAIMRHTLEQWGREQCARYVQELDKQFHALAARPKKGKLRPELAENLRSFPQGRHIIYYRAQTGKNAPKIVIIGILHARMDPVTHVGKTT